MRGMFLGHSDLWPMSDVACHEHGTALSGFLPTSWDHLDCQSWDHPARLAGGSGFSSLTRRVMSVDARRSSRVGFREVSVVEVREVLRAWLEGHGLRKVAERSGVDRKTACRYVAAAEASGLTLDAGFEAVTDDLVGLVVEEVRPARPNGHGAWWEALLEREDQIRAWVAGEHGVSGTTRTA
jgi:hypothetical protein